MNKEGTGRERWENITDHTLLFKTPPVLDVGQGLRKGESHRI